jgi:hypothetical protein
LGEALLEPLDPAWVEQVQAQIVELEVGVGGQVQEEGQPEIAGGFSRDVYAVKGIVVQGIQQEPLGPRIAYVGVVNGNVRFERPTVGKEQAKVCPLLTKVDADLQTIVHRRFSST